MPKKIDQKEEKRARNEIYADRFKREDDEDKGKKKKEEALYANWCRVAGHPASCNCVYL